jgi:acylphosphatase
MRSLAAELNPLSKTMATKPSTISIRKRIQVTGVVQGVGFRPFVYNLAQELALSGYTLNSSAGVTIELEGEPDTIESFLHTLRTILRLSRGSPRSTSVRSRRTVTPSSQFGKACRTKANFH